MSHYVTLVEDLQRTRRFVERKLGHASKLRFCE